MSLLKGAAKKLLWNSATDKGFKHLKETFTTAPILKDPNPELLFVVEVNISEDGVAAALSQITVDKLKLHPVDFFYLKLCVAKQTYDIGN